MRRLNLLIVAGLALWTPMVTAQEADPVVERTIISPEAVVGQPQGPPLRGEELDRRTDDLAAIMRCPVCQALSVADSPTASALAMKEEVRDLLAAGYSEAQVLEYFETSYGEFILLAPKKTGLNWLVWISPVAVLVLGILIIASRSRKRPATTPVESRSEDDDLSAYAERVRQEVGE